MGKDGESKRFEEKRETVERQLFYERGPLPCCFCLTVSQGELVGLLCRPLSVSTACRTTQARKNVSPSGDNWTIVNSVSSLIVHMEMQIEGGRECA
jgi:hypothetical protein